MKVDFGRTSQDYARHRAGFPDEMFTRLAVLGVGCAGSRVLDLGTGTGALARGLRQRGATVVGLDTAANQLIECRRLDHAAGFPSHNVVARAEHLPFRERTFDFVTAGQCWHWFDAARTLGEIRTVMRADGRLTLAAFDWLPLPGSVTAATEELILRHNPAWHLGGRNGVHAEWFDDLARAGFARLESFSFDTAVPYSHESWRGRIRASAGVGASLTPEGVRAFDKDLAGLLAARFPEEPLLVAHRTFVVVAAP